MLRHLTPRLTMQEEVSPSLVSVRNQKPPLTAFGHLSTNAKRNAQSIGIIHDPELRLVYKSVMPWKLVLEQFLPPPVLGLVQFYTLYTIV